MARRTEGEHQHRRDEQRAQPPRSTRDPHALRLNAIGMPVKGAATRPQGINRLRRRPWFLSSGAGKFCGSWLRRRR
jgi:hypothetical protein